MKRLLYFFAVFLLSACSNPTDSQKENEIIIEQHLTDLALAFNFNDLAGIMSFYREDFLHNGNDYDDEEIIWENRLIDYLEMEINDIEVDIISDLQAVARFELVFINSEEVFTTSEPSSENGDLSYFFYQDSVWKLSGNQQE